MMAARAIIEGLRSGVPYLDTADVMTFGRKRTIDAVESLMETVSSGRRPKSWGYVLRAEYGQGKTHLLYALAGVAAAQNWLVSMVTVSKETPLDRLDFLYPKIINNTYRPGSSQPGLESVIREAVEAPHLAAEARELVLSDRVRIVLDNLIRQDAGFDELVADLHGQFLPAAQLKQFYRENYKKTVKFPTVPMRLEVPHYLALVDWLIGRTEYRGWLILFDEVELLGKFGRGGRARGYANIGRFLSGTGTRTASVWALAGNFQTDVIIQRKEHEFIPLWFDTHPKDADNKELALNALDELAAAKPLDMLPPKDLKELLSQILMLHQDAFNWTAAVDVDQFYEAVRRAMQIFDPRLRTWVRVALTLLDMWFQYPEGNADIQTHGLKEVDLDEDAEMDEMENI
jgi:hypothetical protein